MGIILLLIFAFIIYLALRFKVNGTMLISLFKSAKKDIKEDLEINTTQSNTPIVDNSLSDEAESIKSAFEIPLENLQPTISKHSKLEKPTDLEIDVNSQKNEVHNDIAVEIETTTEEQSETNNLANKLVKDFGEFDPTLELSNYQFPPLELLKKYDNEGISINKEELEEKINIIMKNDHKIIYEYIDSKILDSQPELVRTMSVKPPKIDGKLRFVKIGDIDFQPCGGTHVKSTIEIGEIKIGKIENKGKMNRRVNILLND